MSEDDQELELEGELTGVGAEAHARAGRANEGDAVPPVHFRQGRGVAWEHVHKLVEATHCHARCQAPCKGKEHSHICVICLEERGELNFRECLLGTAGNVYGSSNAMKHLEKHEELELADGPPMKKKPKREDSAPRTPVTHRRRTTITRRHPPQAPPQFTAEQIADSIVQTSRRLAQMDRREMVATLSVVRMPPNIFSTLRNGGYSDHRPTDADDSESAENSPIFCFVLRGVTSDPERYCLSVEEAIHCAVSNGFRRCYGKEEMEWKSLVTEMNGRTNRGRDMGELVMVFSKAMDGAT